MDIKEDINKDITGSKYNSGIDKIYTMSTIRKGCHDFKIGVNYASWYQCLRSWRSEMNAKFNDDEKSKCDNYHKIFDSRFHTLANKTIVISDKPINVNELTDLEIDNALYEYELYLGELAEKYNMGMPNADDDEGL